ncbi:GAF domain-containing sensor histidine kinase [Aeromicrobium sp. CnD17-E]|uniref:sensor histidine kinase n=1 Tax=Aeromicrobium sp. CnD17-E TaxID=2954487 RepID=UPI0020981FCB|nr:GAF domain-containing sensor histidine kinase [Aeromicrobium sp. CnD17-E]MCO7238163.1 GAF domain-containing protein [Aeromicrobium sp. CnD17-E]
MREPGVGAERQSHLLDAVVGLSQDLSFDNVLQRIVDSASELVGATYGFLGVLDSPSSHRMGTFAVHGLDQEHQDLIGRLPEGKGLLGLVIDHPGPVRLEHLGDHPESVGFPNLHPAMTSFLGVPIRVHDTVFGNLYLTDKIGGGGFTAEDQEVAVTIAAAAGVVVENVRLYEESERQRRWLRATTEVANALLRPISRQAASQLIVDRICEVSEAGAAALVVPTEEHLFVVAASTGIEPDPSGHHVDIPFLREVVRTHAPVVLDDVLDDTRIDDETLAAFPGLQAVQAHPLHFDDGTAVIVMGWFAGQPPSSWSLDPELPYGFTQQAALVMQVVRARESQAKLAILEDRERIGRDLHDLVIQRLFAIGLSLDSISASVTPQVGERLSDAVDGLDQTIKEIRRTIFDLSSPSVPANLRLEIDAIVGEAERMLGYRPVVDTHGPVESVVPDIVAEQLTAVLKEMLSNIVRHSHAGEVTIDLDVTDGIVLTVTDDGLGLDPEQPFGNGLRNMRHRAQNLGGTCEFSEPSHGGLQIRWSVPQEMS